MSIAINPQETDNKSYIFYYQGKSVLVKAHPKFDRYWCGEDGHIYSVKQKHLRQMQEHINRNGYLQVGISQNGKVRTSWVHILIADAWLRPAGRDEFGNPRNQINHKDLVKTNNKVSNLERNSAKENSLHFRYMLRKIADETLSIDT